MQYNLNYYNNKRLTSGVVADAVYQEIPERWNIPWKEAALESSWHTCSHAVVRLHSPQQQTVVCDEHHDDSDVLLREHFNVWHQRHFNGCQYGGHLCQWQRPWDDIYIYVLSKQWAIFPCNINCWNNVWLFLQYSTWTATFNGDNSYFVTDTSYEHRTKNAVRIIYIN